MYRNILYARRQRFAIDTPTPQKFAIVGSPARQRPAPPVFGDARAANKVALKTFYAKRAENSQRCATGEFHVRVLKWCETREEAEAALPDFAAFEGVTIEEVRINAGG